MTRETGVEHGAIRDRRTWTDHRNEGWSALGYTRQPYVLIVGGGGQGGIGLGARLKRLGVPALIVDAHPRPGDALAQALQVASACMTRSGMIICRICRFRTIGQSTRPRTRWATGWSPTPGSCIELLVARRRKRASWNAAAREWSVVVEREGAPVTLRPKHLVLATGIVGFPEVPRFPAESFKGEQRHSSEHAGGAGFAGKRCVVIGSNNSAYDIAADLWEHGADVTMLQRSPTMVARSETLARLGRTLYSEAALEAGAHGRCR